MTDHLPECPLTEPCSADHPRHGFCSRQSTWCIHCERGCICDRLRACEQRVLSVAGPHNYTRGRKDGYMAALDRARDAVAALLNEDTDVFTSGGQPDCTCMTHYCACHHEGKWEALAAIDALRGQA